MKKAAIPPAGPNASGGKRLTWAPSAASADADETSLKIAAAQGSGTSIFDPALCEILISWFCPPGGLVLDPFAGGSVRGIVASALGRRYVGIELRAEQVSANGAQWSEIRERAGEIAGAEPFAPVWACGDARDALPEVKAERAFDFILSCPPYFNLERYSDDPRDLSAMKWPAFQEAYREIIAKSAALLAPDRFAAWVIGDVRAPDGFYRGLPALSIAAFEAAGARLYNDAVLVTSVGSLPLRIGRAFAGSRKLGKTHQNVLIFCNGDPAKAAAACGPVEIADLAESDEDPMEPSAESGSGKE